MPSGFVTNNLMHVQEIIVLRPQLSRKKVQCPQFLSSMFIYLVLQTPDHAVGRATCGPQVQILNWFFQNMVLNLVNATHMFHCCFRFPSPRAVGQLCIRYGVIKF